MSRALGSTPSVNPVGGTRAKVWVWDNQTQVEYQRSEPLGQSITQNPPPEEGFENYSAYKGNVGEPEWQCEIPKEWYGKFSAMPTHCQRKAMENAGSTLPYEDEKPTTIIFAASNHAHGMRSSHLSAYDSGKPSNLLAKFAATATAKKIAATDDDDSPTWEVEIKDEPEPLPPGLPDDLARRLNAANGNNAKSDGQSNVKNALGRAKDYLMRNEDCLNFLNGVLREINTIDINYTTLKKRPDDPLGKLWATPLNAFELLDIASRAKVIETKSDGLKSEGSTEYTNDLSARPGGIYVNKSFGTQKREAQVFSVIHEAFHMLSEVDDLGIARAAQIADNPSKKPSVFKDTAEGRREASMAFNRIVQRRCVGLSTSTDTVIR